MFWEKKLIFILVAMNANFVITPLIVRLGFLLFLRSVIVARGWVTTIIQRSLFIVPNVPLVKLVLIILHQRSYLHQLKFLGLCCTTVVRMQSLSPQKNFLARLSSLWQRRSKIFQLHKFTLTLQDGYAYLDKVLKFPLFRSWYCCISTTYVWSYISN